jgi:hypothetical protein
MDFKIILIVVVLLVVAVAVVAAGMKPAGRAGTYKRRKLMTENEREFFARLVTALPDHYIFPQVALSGLIEAASSNKQKAHGDRLRIAQQRADFVICDAGCEVIAVVELDDRTHSATKDQLRDSRLEQAGIRTIRFQSKNKPAPEAIRAAVMPPVPVADVKAALTA